MPTKKAKVIPEPAPGTRSVLVITGQFAAIQGDGDQSYVCGSCGFVFVKDVNRGQIINMVFKCPTCDSFNEI